ncbi:MAG: efflux RND transporter periplasmic adaptor subunit [Sulfurimonas sp.]|nr:efflux RND transporter periplasmic adaptor subunit [Sulfurimonas sp.]
MKKYLLYFITLLFFSACGEHSHHDEKHSHHDEKHSHHDELEPMQVEIEPIVITDYTQHTELFVEFSPLVVNRQSRFLAHFTNMENFKPFVEGDVEVCLNFKQKKECFSVDAPTRDGIFIPTALPTQAGEIKLSVSISYDGKKVTHNLGKFMVYKSINQIPPSVYTQDETISYLKEQQWQVEFAIQMVKKRHLRESISTFTTIEIPNNAQYMISAPVSGIITSNKEIYVGVDVKANQTVAYIIPLLGQKEDLSTLKLSLKKAQSQLILALSEKERLDKLKAKNAVSQKRIMAGEQKYEIALAQLANVKQRLKQFDTSSNNKLGISLKSPISGTIARQIALSGSYIKEGDEILHIVNPKKLWLNVAIAQSEVQKIINPLGVEIFTDIKSLDFSVESNAKFLYFSDIIDSKTRTASLIFEIDNPPLHLKSGANFASKVYTGKTINSLAIPKSAIVSDNGVDIVYVLVEGEKIERRNVELGLSDSGYIEVLSGVSDGERVVSKGAYGVLLSALSPAEAGHGHAH